MSRKNTHKFKDGDKIECVDVNKKDFRYIRKYPPFEIITIEGKPVKEITLGKKYEVIQVRNQSTVFVINDDGIKKFYSIKRFRTVVDNRKYKISNIKKKIRKLIYEI
jgi:hypothetical protein